MASLESVGKAKTVALLLEQAFGVPVTIEYGEKYSRLYYQPDRLLQMQKKVEKMASTAPGDLRIDWLPVIQPYAVKRAAPYVLGVLALGFLLGRMT